MKTQSQDIYIKTKVKILKIHHLHTTRPVGILRQQDPRCGLLREQIYECIGSEGCVGGSGQLFL